MKRKGNWARIKKILVPTDFSSQSTPALDYAAMIARQFNAEIILMHVVESLPYSVTDTFNVIEHRTALTTLARSILDNMQKRLREEKMPVKTHVASGTPYREILKKSRQARANLIVMGTHGRTGLEHLLMGSVAERVVRMSTCPVVTVR